MGGEGEGGTQGVPIPRSSGVSWGSACRGHGQGLGHSAGRGSQLEPAALLPAGSRSVGTWLPASAPDARTCLVVDVCAGRRWVGGLACVRVRACVCVCAHACAHIPPSVCVFGYFTCAGMGATMCPGAGGTQLSWQGARRGLCRAGPYCNVPRHAGLAELGRRKKSRRRGSPIHPSSSRPVPARLYS